MTPDQIAGSLLVVCAIAFAAISLACLTIRMTADNDTRERNANALAYVDLAQHEAWVRGETTDYEPTPIYEALCVDRWEQDTGDAS